MQICIFVSSMYYPVYLLAMPYLPLLIYLSTFSQFSSLRCLVMASIDSPFAGPIAHTVKAPGSTYLIKSTIHH